MSYARFASPHRRLKPITPRPNPQVSIGLHLRGGSQTQGIQISMDGVGRWRDNVFVERLWRSLKYEEVYRHAYETVRDAQDGVARYMTFYNQIRPHRALDGRTPDRVYWEHLPARPTAA